MPESEREVRFCYRCGKRVGKGALNCWYCSAPTTRAIRPIRHCPFCQQAIGPKALKCHHCGEFVDGRAPASPQHFTLNIDKAVIAPGGINPLTGQPQSPPVQPLNQQAFQGGAYTALPQASPAQISPDQTPLLGSSQSPQLLPYDPNMPMATGQEHGSSLAPFTRQGGAVNPIVPAQGPLSLGRPAPPNQQMITPMQQASLAPASGAPARESRASGASDEEGRYFVCPVCHTEILTSDNYCFHCGQRRPGAAAPKAKTPSSPIPFGSYVMALAIAAAGRGTEYLLPLIPKLRTISGDLVAYTMLGLALLLLLQAFVGHRGLVNKILTLAVAFGLLVMFFSI